MQASCPVVSPWRASLNLSAWASSATQSGELPRIGFQGRQPADPAKAQGTLEKRLAPLGVG